MSTYGVIVLGFGHNNKPNGTMEQCNNENLAVDSTSVSFIMTYHVH